MKTHRTTILTGLVALGTLGACSTTNQMGQQTALGDVDPMYAQYRAPALEVVALNEPVKADYNKGSYAYQDEQLSSKTVNPDLVAQYQNGDQRTEEEGAGDDYYVEEYNRPGAYGNQPQVVNNFYGNPNRFGAFGNPAFAGGFYDPFFDPFMMGPGMGFYDPFWPGMGMGFGNPWAQPWGRPGFNVSLGFGWGRPGWGGGFGFNRWNRFGGFGGGFYDPFFNPWGPSMAFGGWGMGGFYGRPNVLIVNNGGERNIRTPYTRGTTNRVVSRANQGDNYTRTNRLTRQNASTRSRNSSRGRSISTASQNEAYSPRSSQASSADRRSSRAYTPQTNRPAVRSTDRSRSTRNQGYSRPYGSSSRGSSYGSSPSRSRSYGNSSRNRSNSYRSSPSRSRSNGYSNSSRSRSSSYSSGSSRGSYSRSSSGGSYSRSSSSSGSSSSGRRGRP